jgi:hypothetical protein
LDSVAAPGPFSIAFARPKSSTLTFAFWRDLHIARLQIPMNDASVVRGFERFTDGFGNIESFFNRNRTPLDALRKSFAFDEFEHEESCTVRFLK